MVVVVQLPCANEYAPVARFSLPIAKEAVLIAPVRLYTSELAEMS